MSVTDSPAPPAAAKRRGGLGDKIFAGLATAAGWTILIALAGVFIFLLVKGLPGLHADQSQYNPMTSGGFLHYVGPLLFGTIFIAVLALIVAVPFALAIALFISHYAPKRLATPVAYVIDLLAAVPSVVYGLWGGTELANALKPTVQWLADHVGWFPLFKGPYAGTGQVALTAVLVLAIMVLPIITAISREVFAQTPRLNEEAAIGLGATRWEVIRLAVLPYAKSGIVAGIMLGLGRALGETMAVLMVYSSGFHVTANIVGANNPQTIAANIANNFGEASDERRSVLIAIGLVLFVFTFAVNYVARWFISRGERRFAR